MPRNPTYPSVTHPMRLTRPTQPTPPPMSDAPAPAPFLVFLRRAADAGGFGTDDVLAAVLPLLEQVAQAHQNQRVAPLDGLAALRVEDTVLTVDPAAFREPRKNPS